MRKVLNTIEKLDATHSGLATVVRSQLDHGVSTQKVSELINKKYPVSVSQSSVGRYRTKVWVPDREKMREIGLTMQVIVKEFGGDAGIDALASARIFEILTTTEDWRKLTEVRELVAKTRAQTLKEQEFMFKTGQLKPGEGADAAAEDPAAEEAKTKRVMNKIRGIFGLDPLPYDTDDQQTEAKNEESENKSQTNPGQIELPPTQNATELTDERDRQNQNG
jgi:hypothetical protein